MAQWTEDQALTKSMVSNILYASLHFDRSVVHANGLTAQFNMPMSHVQLLFAVEEEPLTVGELAQLLEVHKPNVAPTVNSLEKDGYIERKPSSTDRRKMYIGVLPKGKQLCEEMREYICTRLLEDNGLMGLTEARNLNRSLANVVRMIDMKSPKQ